MDRGSQARCYLNHDMQTFGSGDRSVDDVLIEEAKLVAICEIRDDVECFTALH